MTEQETPEPESGTKGEDPFAVEVRKGNVVKFEKDKAHDLMRKGIGYERYMEKNRRALEVGSDLLSLADRNPALAERIVNIANGKEDPESPSGNGAPARQANAVELDEDQLTDAERALMRRNDELASQVDRLTKAFESVDGRLQSHDVERRRDSLSTSIDKEAKAVRTWDEVDVEHFTPLAAAMIAADPSLTPAEAVNILAAQESERAQRKAQAASARAQNGRRFQTESPSSGTPRATPKKEFKAEDLKNGNVLEALMESATRFFPG